MGSTNIGKSIRCSVEEVKGGFIDPANVKAHFQYYVHRIRVFWATAASDNLNSVKKLSVRNAKYRYN